MTSRSVSLKIRGRLMDSVESLEEVDEGEVEKIEENVRKKILIQ